MHETDETELSRLIDGDLPDARLEELLRAAETDPQLHARIAALARNDQRLRTAAAGAYDSTRPLPPELRELGVRLGRRLNRTPAAPERRLRRRMQFAAMLFCAVALGWTAAVLARPGQTAPAAFVDEAADAHHAAALAPALDEPADPGALKLLAEAFDRDVQPPDLRSNGLRLSGVDVVPTDLGPAILFSYVDAQRRPYTLVISFAEELRGGEDAPDEGPQAAAHGGVAICFWRDGGGAYALVATAPASRLAGIARSIARARAA